MDEPARFCLSCRYNLAGLSARECPECGRAFDPADPSTTADHHAFDDRLFYAYTARAFTVAVAALSGVAIVLCASGVDLLLLWMAGVLLSPLVLGLMVAALHPRAPLSRRWRLAAIASASVLVSIIITDWPFRITFELHRPAMNRAVQQFRSGQLATGTPMSVGFFTFRDVQIARDGHIGFQLTGGPGGGIFLVHHPPESTSSWLWRNTNWEQNLLGGWHRAYED